MAQIIDMPWDWPVEVNYLEAKAFCNWLAHKTGKPLRLPTEAEWYRLRDLHDIPDQPAWQKAPGNINLEHWASSCPVNRFAFGEFFDIVGNVWQWTETPITGFDGFQIHPCYDDFSTPTFDTQHNLIKGGSWISTGNEATRDSRYAFRRHFFQHAGLRYVLSEQPLAMPEAMYETDSAVSQYCEAHYGKTYFNVPNYSASAPRPASNTRRDHPRGKALDLGCAVGRASFELARHFDQVTGIDFSARFIRVALQLKEKGVAYFELVEEGEVVSCHEARLAELGLDRVADRVEFYQGDATNLKPQFTAYDLVLAANLIDRLYDPKRFLETIHDRLKPGGILVITSPYTWLEEFTKKEHWLGGFRKGGEPYMTLDALRELLGPHFVMLDAPRNVEFVIRETRRKFQHTVAENDGLEPQTVGKRAKLDGLQPACPVSGSVQLGKIDSLEETQIMKAVLAVLCVMLGLTALDAHADDAQTPCSLCHCRPGSRSRSRVYSQSACPLRHAARRHCGKDPKLAAACAAHYHLDAKLFFRNIAELAAAAKRAGGGRLQQYFRSQARCGRVRIAQASM